MTQSLEQILAGHASMSTEEIEEHNRERDRECARIQAERAQIKRLLLDPRYVAAQTEAAGKSPANLAQRIAVDFNPNLGS